MSRRIKTESSPYITTLPRSGDSLHQIHNPMAPRHKKRPNLMVTALTVPVFLMAAFIFKIHMVDLPHIEANHFPSRHRHPHIGKKSRGRHLEKIRRQKHHSGEEGTH